MILLALYLYLIHGILRALYLTAAAQTVLRLGVQSGNRCYIDPNFSNRTPAKSANIHPLHPGVCQWRTSAATVDHDSSTVILKC